jgi:arylsulfatase
MSQSFPTLRSAAFALACLTVSCSPQPEAVPPPHILFLSVDTLRPDYLGMYGYDRDSSPYLDALLADAFHFPKAVASVPRTTPSLASILTGAYPHTTGVRELKHALKDEVVPITELLQEVGYQTIAVVTNQLLSPERKLSRGFEVYLPAKDTRDAAATTDVLLEQVAQVNFDQPLFLWAHYIDPHIPYVSPPEIVADFDPDYTGRYKDNFGQFPPPVKPGKKLRWGGPYPPDLRKQIAVHQNPLPEPVVEHVRRLYAADIRQTDNQIKRLVEDLRRRTGDNLMIVFTSDHGESLGEHDFHWDHGDYVYNASSRIPLAILLPQDHEAYGPGSHDEWVSGVDIVPTMLDLLGYALPESMVAQMEGQTLAPAMRGEKLPGQPVFAECGKSHYPNDINGRVDFTVAGRFRAVYLGDWKLIWTPGHDTPEKSWELFNLAQDPHETENLFREDHPEFPRLRDLLMPWAELGMEPVNDEGTNAADLQRLKDLGYTDSEH